MAGTVLPPEVAAGFMAMTQQTANAVQGNFLTAQKELDYDYVEGHRQISLVQALGAREVQAKVTPGGPSQA